MLNEKEVQCIHKANEVRLASAQRRLIEVCENGIPFDNPLNEVNWKRDWNVSPVDRAKLIFSLPSWCIFIILLALITPFSYILHLQNVHNIKKNILNETFKKQVNIQNLEGPENKTLESLWNLYGLNNGEYDIKDKIKLLTDWIEILYGEQSNENLDLNQELSSIVDEHVKTDTLYFQYNVNATNLLFKSPIQLLIFKLSKGLREYEGLQ